MKSTGIFGISFAAFLVLGGIFCLYGQEAQSHLALHCTTIDENGPVVHGLKKLELQLSGKQIQVQHGIRPLSDKPDFYIIAGLASDQTLVSELLDSLKVPLPGGKEGLCIHNTTFRGKPVLLLCGADDVGLMYAALDAAKRISWSKNPKNPFEHVKDIWEKADVKERAVSTGTFQRKYFEERLHDTIYWEKYFDMMAEHRLNQFLLIFGYKNNQYRAPNFTAPVYPIFFNLDEYPLVKLSGITAEQQMKYKTTLNSYCRNCLN